MKQYIIDDSELTALFQGLSEGIAFTFRARMEEAYNLVLDKLDNPDKVAVLISNLCTKVEECADGIADEFVANLDSIPLRPFDAGGEE